MSGDQAKDDVSAIILGGGKSSRMGRPKALLLFDGEPLIAHIVRTLKSLFTDIVIVAAPGQELPSLSVTLVHDEEAYQGPVAGIYYGLKAASREVGFVTSCDVPFLNQSLISYLISQIVDYDVVVPYWEDRLQPLHAVYRRSVVPLLQEQLEHGELRPVSLYKNVRTREIIEGEIRSFDPDGMSFLNMNTPEDYQAALKHWRAYRESSVPRVKGQPNTQPSVLSPKPSLAAQDKPFTCTVELFSVARLLSKTDKVSLALPQGATLSHVFLALAERLPILVGPVITVDRNSLTSGNACNINGRDFVRDPNVKVRAGDNIFIISADAGG